MTKPAEERSQGRDRPGAGRIASLALLAGLSLALTLLGLALPWGAASGQTVPRTPPPTWTRTPRPVTPFAPTETPLPTWTPTLAPGAPTPIPLANPALALRVSPEVVGPGMVVRLVVQAINHGSAPAEGAEMSLEVPWPLALRDPQRSTMPLGALRPGEAAEWLVEATVQSDARPGQELSCQAALSYRGGRVVSNAVTITLPPALLPAAGG